MFLTTPDLTEPDLPQGKRRRLVERLGIREPNLHLGRPRVVCRKRGGGVSHAEQRGAKQTRGRRGFLLMPATSSSLLVCHFRYTWRWCIKPFTFIPPFTSLWDYNFTADQSLIYDLCEFVWVELPLKTIGMSPWSSSWRSSWFNYFFFFYQSLFFSLSFLVPRLWRRHHQRHQKGGGGLPLPTTHHPH